MSEYIEAYLQALKAKDKKEMARIERDLQKLGMDKYTLMAVVKEMMKEVK
jgi:hypothetical protein